MKNILHTLPVAFVLFRLALPLSAQTAMQAGLVEEADVYYYFDPQGMSDSEFTKTMEENQSAEEKALANKQLAMFTEATGLEEEDVTALVFSMDIDGIDFKSQDPAQLETAKVIAALEVKKPLTLEQIQKALMKISEETDAPAPELEIAEEDGLQVIRLVGTETPGGVDKAYATLSPDGKTALISFNTAALKDGLARLEKGTTASVTEDMKSAMTSLENQQMAMAVVLPASVREMIQQSVQGAAAQGGMGAMLMPFASTKSLLFSTKAEENMNVALSLDLGDPGNAQQAAGMIQSMLPMLVMGLQEQMGPEAMNLMNKINIAPEGGIVSMKFSLTPAEATMLSNMAPTTMPEN